MTNGGVLSIFKLNNNETPTLFNNSPYSNKGLDTFCTSHISDIPIKIVQGYISGNLVEDLGDTEGEEEGGRLSIYA